MKILVMCAAGFSSSMLVKKMKEYFQNHGIDGMIDCCMVGNFEEVDEKYDVLLLAPQVSYKYDEAILGVSIPVVCIPAKEYAMGNVDAIMKVVNEILIKLH